MDDAALGRRIADRFPRLSPRLQPAFRLVLGRPDGVAPMSMRRLGDAIVDDDQVVAATDAAVANP